MPATALSSTATADPTRERGSARVLASERATWLALGGIFVVAAIVYATLALRASVPVMWPDEFRYAHLARSLVDGQGFMWRGDHLAQPAALYVYFIAPMWAAFHSTVSAYHASKILDTLALCSQIVPVYLLGRRLLGARLALVPAALSVAGTWMVTSAELATETLAFPLTTTALCLMVMVIQRPGRRIGFIALAAALVAAWARIQLVALVPAFAVALLLDVVRMPRGRRRERLELHLPYLSAAAALFAFMLVAVLAAPSLSGDYSTSLRLRPAFSLILGRTALELGGLVALTGFVPVALGLSVAARRTSWSDSHVAPLLCVFLPTALLTALQSGFFLAGQHQYIWWGIERYVAYTAPLAFVLAAVVATDRKFLTATTFSIAGMLAALLVLHPNRASLGEERAAWSTAYRLHQALGLSTGVALTVAGVLGVGIVAFFALRARGASHTRVLVALFTVTAVFLVVQDQASWHRISTVTRTFRTTSLPSDLQWVDHHSPGPVALLGLTQNAPGFEVIDFFNRDITQAYGPSTGLRGRTTNGRVCAWEVDTTGKLIFQPDCGPVPHGFFINDPAARMTFYNEISSASDEHIGRVVRVAPVGAPRMRSLLVLPCPRLTPTFFVASPRIISATAPFRCGPDLGAALWLDQPAQFVVRYAGGNVTRTVSAQGRSWQIAPRRVTSVRLPVARGADRVTVHQSWRIDSGNPRILDVQLVRGDNSSSLI